MHRWLARRGTVGPTSFLLLSRRAGVQRPAGVSGEEVELVPLNLLEGLRLSGVLTVTAGWAQVGTSDALDWGGGRRKPAH